jgi:hypothetical protein
MAGSTKTKPRLGAEPRNRTVVVTERTGEILRRAAFLRNCPVKALLEELVEKLLGSDIDISLLCTGGDLPAPSYLHPQISK